MGLGAVVVLTMEKNKSRVYAGNGWPTEPLVAQPLGCVDVLGAGRLWNA